MARQIMSLTERIAKLETQPTTSANPVPPELTQLRGRLDDLTAIERGVTSAELKEILAERDRVWEERLQRAEQGWEARLRVLEERLSDFGKGMTRGRPTMQGGLGFMAGYEREHPPNVVLTSTTPSPRKRPPPSPYPMRTPDGGPSKKQRIQPPTPASDTDDEVHEGDTREAEDEDDEPPRTPAAPPRTPSPGHQGLRPDNSKSPLIDGNYFSAAPNFGSNSTLFPMYATTPRPSNVPLISPTVDAPPSASRARLAGTGPPPKQLTPSKKRTERMTPVPTTRAVSNAHNELSTITDGEGFGGRLLASVRRRVASAEPNFGASFDFGEELGGGGGGEGSRPPSRGLSPSPDIPDGMFKKPKFLPSRFSRQEGSPGREYMEVALHGLPEGEGGAEADSRVGGMGGTPGSGRGPGSRTLLGTERWRDTRFGDVPVVQWGTPRVDLGPGTPGFGSG
jgi:hypothetical protein